MQSEPDPIRSMPARPDGETSADFEILASDSGSAARRGRVITRHGAVDTPAFLPVGSRGAVKAVSPAELRQVGAQMILSNTYHLAVRPGVDIIQACGGLHRFMGWDGPILTDSGGYQVFSLAKLRRIRADGVEFNSHVDGAPLFLGPVAAMDIQRMLGSDIAMCFDECLPYPCDRNYACQSVEKTITWAALCSKQPRAEGQMVFAIVQGRLFARNSRGPRGKWSLPSCRAANSPTCDGVAARNCRPSGLTAMQ